MRVFLSHSSKDKKAIRRLASDLQNVGIDVWLDEYEIKIGDIIIEKLNRGIEECDYLLIWLTKKSVKSPWVQREWYSKYHVEIETNKILVLPLLAEDCDIPLFLKTKRYADFRFSYNQGLRELLKVFDKKLILNAIIKANINEPVSWKYKGFPVELKLSLSNLPKGYKIVCLLRNDGEDENIWHFQFERKLNEIIQTLRSRVWFGTRTLGNNEYFDIVFAIVPIDIKYKRHPAVIKLDFDDFFVYSIKTVYRNDKKS
jgi:hypothetical protein